MAAKKQRVGASVARRQGRAREHILTAARELVLESGPEHLSLRKVAERASFSPASLYEYFDGKDDIVRALSERVARRLDERMASVPRPLPPPKRLVRYGQAYVAFARENPEDFVLLFHHLRSKRTATTEPVEGGSYLRLLEAAREGIADQSIARRDPEGVAYGLWAVAHGLAMLQITHLRGFDIDFEAADADALRTYVEGLRAP